MTQNQNGRFDRSATQSVDIATSALSRETPIGQSANQEAATVAGWLERGRGAIPQYERDATRAEWMFRKMEAFANQYGHRLAVIRREKSARYLT